MKSESRRTSACQIVETDAIAERLPDDNVGTKASRSPRPGSRKRFSASFIAPTAFALGLLLCAGCGAASDRLEISGKVTLDGAPLSDATIRLSSLEGPAGAAGAMIQSGEYLIPQEKGLRPGKYHVEINAPDVNAPPVMAPAGPGEQSVPAPPERAPPEYNVESTQSIEVTAGGDNHFVFDMVSRAAK